jgi:hypothetical protein
MVWVLRVGAHPRRECLVIGKQSGVIAALRESRGLRFWADVEETDGDRVELGGRWSGDDFAGWDRIAGEQKVPTDRLKCDGPVHNRLRGLLAPGFRRSWRDADDVTEFDTLDLGG